MIYKVEKTAFEFCKVTRETFQDSKSLKMFTVTLPKRKGVETGL